VNHSQELHKTSIVSNTESSTIQRYNVEDTQKIEIGIQNNPNELGVMNDSNSNVTAITSEISTDKSISESAVLQIEDLKKKLKAANEKLQIANVVIRKVEKTKKNLLQQDEREKDCMLALDEISLTPGEQIDTSTNFPIGYATIPNSRGKSITAFSGLNS
ncbi:vam6 vps39-like protein, partial [Lasius niger]